jgi:hypothetical protein
MAMPDQWTEKAYVAISDEDGNQVQFGARTDTIDITFGAKDIESIPIVNAGRITKFSPEEDSELSLELYPVGVSADSSDPNGLLGWFMGLSPSATSGTITFARKRFRVAILWTTASSVSDAAGSISSADSFRISFWGCYMTELNNEFTDDIVKSSVTFKCPPYNRSAAGLIKVEEADGAVLSSLNPYTGNTP